LTCLRAKSLHSIDALEFVDVRPGFLTTFDVLKNLGEVPVVEMVEGGPTGKEKTCHALVLRK